MYDHFSSRTGYSTHTVKHAVELHDPKPLTSGAIIKAQIYQRLAEEYYGHPLFDVPSAPPVKKHTKVLSTVSFLPFVPPAPHSPPVPCHIFLPSPSLPLPLSSLRSSPAALPCPTMHCNQAAPPAAGGTAVTSTERREVR